MRIAVCDDSKQERRNLIGALNRVIRNFTADEFENGDELLKAHADKPYDIIMLDIIMPGQNGIDTAAVIRRTDTKTPVVFVSSSEEFGVLSYRVAAFDYLLSLLKTGF